jgi:hypothetical protein
MHRLGRGASLGKHCCRRDRAEAGQDSNINPNWWEPITRTPKLTPRLSIDVYILSEIVKSKSMFSILAA